MNSTDVRGSIRQIFAANLVRWRLLRELTQEELAERADLHPVFISGCERGKNNPSIGTVAMLAYALDCTVIELLETTNEIRAGMDSSSLSDEVQANNNARMMPKPKIYASIREREKKLAKDT